MSCSAAEFEVAFVLFGNIGHRKARHRNVHAFLVFDVVVVLGLDDDFLGLFVLLDDFHLEVAIIDQDDIADFDVAIKSGIGAIELLTRAFHGGLGDPHDLAFFDRDAAVFHIAGADFRAFGVESDGDVDPVLLLETAGNLDLGELLFMGAMRKLTRMTFMPA
jgi:hypothetical protein